MIYSLCQRDRVSRLTNFDSTLPEAIQKQAYIAVKDEYTFGFLNLKDEHSNSEI